MATKMKTAVALAIILVFCGCTGCGRQNEDVVDSEVVYQIESANTGNSSTVEVPDAEEPEVIKLFTGETTTTEEATEEIQVELVGRDDFNPNLTESWGVDVIDNLVPIVPEGYDGTLVDYTTSYTGKDGKEEQRTYEDVAFVDAESEYIDYDKYYMTSDIIDVEGEEKSGWFICNKETMLFLEHKKGEDVVEKFYLDIDEVPENYYIHVAARNEKAALIWDGSYLFTYNFETEKCSLITDSALNFKSPVEDELYFTDWNHREYKNDWANSSEVVATGRTVVTYFYDCELQAIDDEVLQANFTEIQKIAKNNELKKYKEYLESKGYEVYRDHLYDNAKVYGYSGSIHLPFASNNSGYCVFDTVQSAWAVESTSLTLYRYGDVVRKYNIEEGNWAIVDSTLAIEQSVLEESVLTAEQFDGKIMMADVLLLNNDDNCLYHISDNGNTTIIAENVVDCYASYEDAGIVYWLDSTGNAYELFWCIDDESILIGEEAIGIAKIRGERAGFIVKPGDPRCNAIDAGVHLCTQYGHEWLNQDKTTAAWALEYDWN